jgi:hypothetical protein
MEGVQGSTLELDNGSRAGHNSTYIKIKAYTGK